MPIKQSETVIQALENLGGVATLGQLYRETMKIPNCKWGTKTPFASIRRIVQTQIKDIYKIKPGLYGLNKYKKQNENKGIIQETSKNKDAKEIREFNHSYYQGILIIVGNLKQFKTFCPDQDKNKTFLDRKLSELRSLKEIPKFSYDFFVDKCKTIDTVWFNEKDMPKSLFEIEHSTDIYSSLIKFNELQDFNTAMLIVADKPRRPEYDNKIRMSSFKEISRNVKFLDYESLITQYEAVIKNKDLETLII